MGGCGVWGATVLRTAAKEAPKISGRLECRAQGGPEPFFARVAIKTRNLDPVAQHQKGWCDVRACADNNAFGPIPVMHINAGERSLWHTRGILRPDLAQPSRTARTAFLLHKDQPERRGARLRWGRAKPDDPPYERAEQETESGAPRYEVSTKLTGCGRHLTAEDGTARVFRGALA